MLLSILESELFHDKICVNIVCIQNSHRESSTVCIARDAGKGAERIKVHASSLKNHENIAPNSREIHALFAQPSKKSMCKF